MAQIFVIGLNFVSLSKQEKVCVTSQIVLL